MIPADQLTSIGRFIKPHGIKGEISAATDLDIDSLQNLSCIFICIDGLYVPFFISGLRERSQGAMLVTIEDIDTQQKAAALASKEFFAKSDELTDDDDDPDGLYIEDLVGYTLHDNDRLIGKVVDYDDSTANVLLLVENADGKILHIPAATELFEDINTDTKTIIMNLPAGITEL